MAFANIFKDKNDINEKSVIGFMSFSIMVFLKKITKSKHEKVFIITIVYNYIF